MPLLLLEEATQPDHALRSVLADEGYTVAAVTSWQELLAHPDLGDDLPIVLDVRLTRGATAERLAELRRVAPQAGVILIVDDDESSRADIGPALEIGTTDFLLRPVRAEWLRIRLANFREQRELRSWTRNARRGSDSGRVLRAFCHEYSNCILTAQFAVDVLAKGGSDPATQTLCTSRLQVALQHLRALQRDVGLFLEPIELQRGPADLREIWREAWQAALCQHLPSSIATLHEETDGSVPCLVDRGRLRQAFQSLFTDALAACSERADIRISCSPDARAAWQIRIRDPRVGLTPDQAAKYLDPAAALKQLGRMALVVSRLVVEMHGGELTVAAEPAAATFTLTLPRIAPNAM